jgi:hypothetical protein
MHLYMTEEKNYRETKDPAGRIYCTFSNQPRLHEKQQHLPVYK